MRRVECGKEFTSRGRTGARESLTGLEKLPAGPGTIQYPAPTLVPHSQHLLSFSLTHTTTRPHTLPHAYPHPPQEAATRELLHQPQVSQHSGSILEDLSMPRLDPQLIGSSPCCGGP